jgi:hypothetical protein
MNDMALYCEYAVADAVSLSHVDRRTLNHDLRRRLHNRGGYGTPLEFVERRVRARGGP